MDLLTLSIPLLVGAGTSAVATPLVVGLALKLGVVDRPNERKVNRRANIPLLGGLAVALGFTVALALSLSLQEVTGVAAACWA